MEHNCSTCRFNDDMHQQKCSECIRVGGASGLPHYQEGTPEEIAANQARVDAKRRTPEEVLKAMDEHLPPPKDMVTLPEHYARFKIEPIRFIVENGLNWFQGNIVKYSLRYDAKNGEEDLRKAQRYMQMQQAFLKGDPDWWKAQRG